MSIELSNIDDFQFDLLMEAGWQPPYRTAPRDKEGNIAEFPQRRSGGPTRPGGNQNAAEPVDPRLEKQNQKIWTGANKPVAEPAVSTAPAASDTKSLRPQPKIEQKKPGYYVIDQNGEPVNDVPFHTKEEAQAIAIDTSDATGKNDEGQIASVANGAGWYVVDREDNPIGTRPDGKYISFRTQAEAKAYADYRNQIKAKQVADALGGEVIHATVAKFRKNPDGTTGRLQKENNVYYNDWVKDHGYFPRFSPSVPTPTSKFAVYEKSDQAAAHLFPGTPGLTGKLLNKVQEFDTEEQAKAFAAKDPTKYEVKELGDTHLGKHDVEWPTKTEPDRLSETGYVIVDPEGKVVKGPFKSEDGLQQLAAKLGDGYAVKPHNQPDVGVVGPARGGGRAKFIDASNKDDTGWYVVNDQNPEIRIEGPFKTEFQARNATDQVAQEYAEAEFNGQTPPQHQIDREINKQKERLSVYYFDKKKEDEKKAAHAAKLGPGGLEKGSHNARKWEYGDMRGEQLRKLEAGEIDPNAPADNNPSQDYLNGTPTFENLKKVFCPLILDKKVETTRDAKGNVVRKLVDSGLKPWTLHQLFNAMKPGIYNIAKKWTSPDFDLQQAVSFASEGLLQATLNDEGRSPFPGYADYYIAAHMRKAKKTGGSVGRSQRAQGWMSGNVDSLDAPLRGSGEGEEKTLGDEITGDASLYDAIDCPTCSKKVERDVIDKDTGKKVKKMVVVPGTGEDPADAGVKCEYCHGTGQTRSTKKGTLVDCQYCGGKKGGHPGILKHPCPTCDGTGKIIPRATPTDLMNDIQGGLQIDPTTGEMKLTPGKVNGTEEGAIGTQNNGDVDLAGDEAAGRMNDSAKLMYGIIDAASKTKVDPLTNQQKIILALAFGLDSSGDRALYGKGKNAAKSNEGRGPKAVGDMLGHIRTEVARQKARAEGKPESEVEKITIPGVTGKAIADSLKGAINKIRRVILHSKDRKLEPLYDAFEDYQKRYGLLDLKEIEKLPTGDKASWASAPPWKPEVGGSKGGAAHTDEERELVKIANDPWYRKPMEEYTSAEHREAIKDLLNPELNLVSQMELNDWLTQHGVASVDDTPPEKLLQFHQFLQGKLDKATRHEHQQTEPSYYMDKNTGEPLELPFERSRRRAELAASKYADKAASWKAAGKNTKNKQGVERTAPALNKAELDDAEAMLPKATGTPLAKSAHLRRIARNLGVDLNKIDGTGPNGEITVDDVKKAAQRDPLPPRVEPDWANGPIEPPLPVRKVSVDEAIDSFLDLMTFMEEKMFESICEEVANGQMGEEALTLLD